MTFAELCKRYDEGKKNGTIKDFSTYRVYYRDGGVSNFCWVEAENAKAARQAAVEQQYVQPETITRVVRDC